MRKFKAGIYQEVGVTGDPDRVNFDIVIIEGERSFEDTYYTLVGSAWRKPTGEWDSGDGAFNVDTLRPHPDPDAAWAEYTKWILTK